MKPPGEQEASVIAEIVGDAVLAPRVVAGDADILHVLPPPPALVVVDAPLAIPNRTGKRDVEAVLAWCDVPAFPVSEDRMKAVFGGARGVALAAELRGRGYGLAETIPDLVIRELLWERERPAGLPALDLRVYREAWLQHRPPTFRPDRRGTARPEAFHAAYAALAEVIDLAAWTPSHDPRTAAAELDAIACAYSGGRHLTASASVDLGDPKRGRMLLPADTNLAARIALTVDRLRVEGKIEIPSPSARE